MEDATGIFERLRPRLHGIATRLLRSATAAGAVMQETRARWAQAPPGALRQAEPWLIFVTVRLCLARLPRRALDPATLLQGATSVRPVTGDRVEEQADDILIALLCSLELLSPDERIAYLLHKVFRADDSEIAQLLGQSEPACRQLIRSAYLRLGKSGAQTPPGKAADVDFRLLRRFAFALAEGDIKALEATLASDAELVGDGSGRIPRFLEPVQGARHIVHRFVADSLRYGDSIRMELIVHEARWILLFVVDGELDSALRSENDGLRILRLHVQRPHGDFRPR